MAYAPSRPKRIVKGALRGPSWWWRRATSSFRDLPTFVVVGAQRAGTTSLFDWLAVHPQVAPAFTKEVHYFDLNYHRGASWYRAHFALTRAARACGEASPYLLFHPLAPERAARDLPPETVFLAVLRDPVERALSHYRHERALGIESLPLLDALDAEAGRLNGEHERVQRGEDSFVHQHFSYIARGEYAQQLERWFGCVGRHRMHVFDASDLFCDIGARQDLLAAIGLSAHGQPYPAANSAPSFVDKAGEEVARRRLREHYRPHNDRLAVLLGRPMAWV